MVRLPYKQAEASGLPPPPAKSRTGRALPWKAALEEIVKQPLLSLNPLAVELSLALRAAQKQAVMLDDFFASANKDIPDVAHGVPPDIETIAHRRR